MFHYKDKLKSWKTFNDFTYAYNLYKKIKKGGIDIEKVRKNKK